MADKINLPSFKPPAGTDVFKRVMYTNPLNANELLPVCGAYNSSRADSVQFIYGIERIKLLIGAVDRSASTD